VDILPGCSVNISGCVSSHIKVTNSDCSVVDVSECSSLSNSKSPTNTPTDLTCLPGNVSKSKDDASKVQLVDLTKVEPADTLPVKSNDVVLLESHYKRASVETS